MFRLKVGDGERTRNDNNLVLDTASQSQLLSIYPPPYVYSRSN